MPNWSDVLNLISFTPPEKRTDENGFANKPTEQSRSVFGNKLSVGQAEFYRAQQAGIKADMRFDIYTADYAGETVVEYEGKRYGVLRTYVAKGGEITELTLTDLSQRGTGTEAGDG